jgi:hypothetical protein
MDGQLRIMNNEYLFKCFYQSTLLFAVQFVRNPAMCPTKIKLKNCIENFV